MENKGLLALGAVLCLLLGALGCYTVMPEKEVLVPYNVTNTVTEIVYVNETVDKSAMDSTLFNKVYESELKEIMLEDAAFIAFNEEFDAKDFEDFLESNITGFDELKSFTEDEAEEEIEVIDLGLNDAEDAEVKVTKEFKVKYEDDNNTDTLKKTVIATGIVTFDEDDNEYNCKITYEFK